MPPLPALRVHVLSAFIKSAGFETVFLGPAGFETVFWAEPNLNGFSRRLRGPLIRKSASPLSWYPFRQLVRHRPDNGRRLPL